MIAQKNKQITNIFCGSTQSRTIHVVVMVCLFKNWQNYYYSVSKTGVTSLRWPLTLSHLPACCSSVQVPAASDLPLHHEVAFIQLRPHLLSYATLTQPLCRKNDTRLRSPWRPWRLTPRRWPHRWPHHPSIDSNSATRRCHQSGCGTELWEAPDMKQGPALDGVTRRLNDYRSLRGLVWFSLV